MCILFIYTNANALPGQYKLILASNRDEFYQRPAAPACRWTDATVPVFGGIDLEPGREGGTWLAISGRNGLIKVGALLNLTGEPHIPNSKGKPVKQNSKHDSNLLGRGPIVSDYVKGTKKSIEYSYEILNEHGQYSAFNFVTVELSPKKINILQCSNKPVTLNYFSNSECHGFGNSLPDVPFEKVKQGTNLFKKIVEENKSNQCNKFELIEKCQNLLKDSRKYWPDKELDRRAPKWGNDLSSINVQILDSGYGSRTHTVITIDHNNLMEYYEETMESNDPSGKWIKTHLQEQF